MAIYGPIDNPNDLLAFASSSSIEFMGSSGNNLNNSNNVGGNNNWSSKNVLQSMKYKDFEWQYNPSSCTYSCTKSIIKHKYPELSGADLEDMDSDGAVISGEGEFFGPDAYNKWQDLVRVFNEHGPGDFYHPVYTDVTQAILQKLEGKLEPRENYVSYSFEFWQYMEPNTRLTVVDGSSTKNENSITLSEHSVSSTHTVRADETLFAIAKRELGDGDLWTSIGRKNNIKDPHTIIAGQKLTMP